MCLLTQFDGPKNIWPRKQIRRTSIPSSFLPDGCQIWRDTRLSSDLKHAITQLSAQSCTPKRYSEMTWMPHIFTLEQLKERYVHGTHMAANALVPLLRVCHLQRHFCSYPMRTAGAQNLERFHRELRAMPPKAMPKVHALTLQSLLTDLCLLVPQLLLHGCAVEPTGAAAPRIHRKYGDSAQSQWDTMLHPVSFR